ncbi:ABC transporter ATP-binding protein [Streptococcus dentapri]|uniref:ABC transporter ATP-binding protein n=1 Tax=Streptococcus dentapri TaxID=573564 RepID=A0ABV8CZT7_9STRE
MLKVQHLSKFFGKNQVLTDIDLIVQKGDFMTIMGPSGCGKSTLLYQISGLDRDEYEYGEVFINENSLKHLSDSQLSKLRLENMGFVFQKSQFLSDLSIVDNIVLPALQLKKQKKKRIYQRSYELLEMMKISDLAYSTIQQVSGGQLQRANICRALINEPSLIFADEPTGALNSQMSQEVMEIFRKLNEEGKTIVLITHDSHIAAYAKHILFMKDGRIISEITKSTDTDFRNKIEKETKRLGI